MENDKAPQYISSKGDLAKQRYDEFEKFRRNLIVLRANKGDSGEKFAKAIGLKSTKRTLDFECGRCHPSFDELRKIANYFNCTLDQLMYGKIITIWE